MRIKNLFLIQSLILASFTNTFAQFDTISVDILPSTSGNVSGDGEYFTGSLVNLEAKPNFGYNFESWTENGSEISEDSLLSFVSFGNRKLTANFELNSYLIGASSLPSEGGITLGGGTYLHGTSVILEANTNTGYSFINWTENNVEVSTDSVLILSAIMSKDYVANFTINSYLISASSTPLGSGTIVGAGNFNHGDSVFLKAIPVIGYSFEYWSENGTEISSDTVYKFVAETSRNLTAHFVLNSYFINANALPIIGGTVGGTGNFKHGVLANLVATPASGYFFSNWTEGDSVVSTDSNYIFVVDKDRDLKANFSEKQFLVSTDVNPEFSGISDGDGSYTNLNLATVLASPNIGWVFNNWSENGKTLAVDSAFSFVVLEDRNLTANFSKKIYNLKLLPFPSEGGNVNGYGLYPHDSIVTITAIPSLGWHFLNWTENDIIVSSDSMLSFNLIGERNIVANFEKDIYQVSTRVLPENAGNTLGDSLYTFGDSVYLVAIPSSNFGWEFVNWTNGEIEVSQDSVLTFISNNNIHLTANFKLKDYSVNLLPFPDNAGMVQGLGTYTHGDSVTVSAEPVDGWLFANWTDGANNISSEPALTFEIESDKILIANFAHELYSLNSTPQPTEAGYVSGSGTFYYDQLATLTPIANPGWEFVNWSENEIEISSDSTLSLLITKNMIIKANFRQINYSINCLANPVEAGNTLGCGISRYNKEMEIMATPNEGWEFVNWTENSEILSTSQNYIFNVIDHRNLVANFQLATSVNAIEDEKIIPEEYYLSNAYPNPFNPATTINFGLPEPSNVKIIVSDINGQIVKTILSDEHISAGNYSTNFEASDLSSGIYLYIILAKGENSSKIFKKVQKMILLK